MNPAPPAPLPPAVFQQPGVVWNLTQRHAEAPFKVITTAGADYFIKLVDAGTGVEAMALYARGGVPLSVDVPLGRYRLKYAYGRVWRSERHLFGPGQHTQFSQTDKVLEFRQSGGYVNGYTIELIRQAGGNMRTFDIERGQF